MIKPISRNLSGIAVFLLALFVVHCQDGGSELPNEVHGELVSKNGLPAANVKVGLYSVNYIPADSGNSGLAWTTKTDAKGNYAFKNVPSGRYNVVGVRDSLGFFRDSLSVSGAAEIGRDSLGLLGTLTGTVQLQPQDEPRNAVVQVMGTDNFVNVDSSGAFTLSGLAGGFYRLRVSVALPNYVPLFSEVQVHTGRRDTLPNPLVPFFSGIPVVTGIHASLDTAHGIARITWHPASYPALLSYLVYRDPENAVELSTTPINLSRIEDSVYFDTLYNSSNDTVAHIWEYRVRVQGNNAKIGEPFKPAVLHTVPPVIFSTHIHIERVGGKLDEIFKGDTVRLAVDYSNASIANRNLTWFHGVSDTLRNLAVVGKTGKDTLIWASPAYSAPDSMRCEITDLNGMHWSETVHLKIVASRIIGNIKTPSDVVHAYPWDGKIVHLSQDLEGRINIALFNMVTKKDTILNANAMVDTPYYSTAMWGSKLFLINARQPDFPGAKVVTYDVATGFWGKEPDLPGRIVENCTVVAGGKLYAISRGANPGGDSLRVSELDLTSHVWTGKKPHAFSWVASLSQYNGSVYLITSSNGPYISSLEIYDPAADNWSSIPVSPRIKETLGSQLVGLNGKLYNLGGGTTSGYSTAVEMYDANQKTWIPSPDYLLARETPGIAAIGSSIYILSGQTMTNEKTATVEEYRPE